MKLSETYEVLKRGFGFDFVDTEVTLEQVNELAEKYKTEAIGPSYEEIRTAFEHIARVSAMAAQDATSMGDAIKAGQCAQSIGTKITPAVKLLIGKAPKSQIEKDKVITLVRVACEYLEAVSTSEKLSWIIKRAAKTIAKIDVDQQQKEATQDSHAFRGLLEQYKNISVVESDSEMVLDNVSIIENESENDNDVFFDASADLLVENELDGDDHETFYERDDVFEGHFEEMLSVIIDSLRGYAEISSRSDNVYVESLRGEMEALFTCLKQIIPGVEVPGYVVGLENALKVDENFGAGGRAKDAQPQVLAVLSLVSGLAGRADLYYPRSVEANIMPESRKVGVFQKIMQALMDVWKSVSGVSKRSDSVPVRISNNRSGLFSAPVDSSAARSHSVSPRSLMR